MKHRISGTSMKNSNRVPWRGIGVGIILVVGLSIWAQYSCNIVQGSPVADDFSAVGAVFFLFFLVGILNPLFKTLKIPFTLNSRDLIAIYIMMITASSVITIGLINQLPILVSPFYYASLHTKFATDIQPYLNSLLIPPKEVITPFFEGLKSGETIPWIAWFKPLSIWMIFFLILFFVMICMLVIIRKQWVENERLTFPLVQLPLAMVEGESSSTKVNPFFKNKLMWFGFAIPFVLGIIIGLHKYFPLIPKVCLEKYWDVFRGTTYIHFKLNFAILGFLYLVRLDVSFSLWFFFLLSFVLTGFLRITGISGMENVSLYGCQGDPIFYHLGTGALVGFVIFSLWIARHHLKEVFKKAIGKNGNIDDKNEVLSYKTAVWGMFIGIIILLVWLNKLAGLKIGVAIFFLMLAFLIFFGLTKIVSQAGIPNAVAPSISPVETVSSLGVSAIGHQGMVGLAQQYIWSADIRANPMTHTANSLKLISTSNQNQRWMFWVIMGAFVIAIVVAFSMFLKLSYDTGGINLNRWNFGSPTHFGANEPYSYVLDRMREKSPPNVLGWEMKILGAAIVALLFFMHYKFLWWPLNPIGFIMGSIWIMRHLWLSVFLAWLLKSFILRYGGLLLYRKLRPFFLGLILGQFTVMNFWLVIDTFAHEIGHSIFGF